MSKNKKNSQKKQGKAPVTESLATENEAKVDEQVKVEEPANNKKEKVVEVKAKDVKKKKEPKVKKPNKAAKALKDTGNELKKVTWPSFGQVCKQTGVVLVFVIVFALVLFGFDRLCAWLTGLLF